MAVRGFKLHGRKVWQARVAYKGLRKSAIRETEDEARQAEADLLQELRAKAEASEQDAQRPATLRQLFEFYVGDLEARGKGSDTVGRAAKTAVAVESLMPELLDQPVTKIGDADIFAFRKKRAETSLPARDLFEQAAKLRRDGKVAEAEATERRAQARQREGTKPATVNRDLRTIRAMFKKARPDYRFPGGAFFKEDDTRVRWLRPEEELLVLESMPSPHREMAKVAALTLMRLSEVRTLRRNQVRLEQGVLELPTTKTEPRYVVLSAAAQKVLHAQMEAHQGPEWVFPGPDGRPYSRVHVSRVFRKASRAAGLRDFHFHDLRHHGATMALNKGFTAPIVMALGGWKTERMMRRYAAVTDQTLRAAAEAVSGSELTLGGQAQRNAVEDSKERVR